MDTSKSLLRGKRIERSDGAAIAPSRDLEQEYIYDPLDTKIDQIRLLRLRRRHDESGLICCNVQIFNITQAPRYRALSYEWGAANPLRQIRVNGALLTIRENLWAFLDMYRTRIRKANYLWIDQICIDQANIEERSRQVQLMSQVFRMATTVLVWLGYSSDPQLSHFRSQLKATLRHKRLPLCWQKHCHICRKCGLRPTMTALAGLTYWRRLWIIQELALARHTLFYLGRQQINRSHLLKYFCLSPPEPYDRERDEHFFVDLNYLRRLLSSELGRVRHIWQIIDDIYCEDVDIRCSDSHDLIFGLLGILSRVPRLRVDYTLPTEEVFGDLLNSYLFSEDGAEPGLPFMFTMVTPMAHLAFRLGVPPRWCEALQIDWKCSDYIPMRSALEGFFLIFKYLEHLGLDRTTLSVDHILTVIAHALHVLRPHRWEVLALGRQEDFVKRQGRALEFFVKLTPRVKAMCTKREVPFRLPHIPSLWVPRDLSDEQLEEFLWPELEASSEKGPIPAQTDCTSCCQYLSSVTELEEGDIAEVSHPDDDTQPGLNDTGERAP